MINPAKYDSWYDSIIGRVCFDREEQLLMASAVFKGSERILELGCGTGRFLFSVMKKSSHVVGIDRDISFLQFVKRKGEEMGLHLTLVQADGRELPFREGQFNVVYEVTTLCFVHNEKRLLQEMIRVCSAGGKILLGELNPISPWQWWRRFKGWFGYGYFKEMNWQFPSSLKKVLRENDCQEISVQRAIFFPPLNIKNYFYWRDLLERIGSILWFWIGAFYLIAAIKRR